MQCHFMLFLNTQPSGNTCVYRKHPHTHMHNAVTVVWCSLGSPQYKHTVTQLWILYSIMYLDYQNDNLLCVQFVPTNSLCGGSPQFFITFILLGRIPRLQPLPNEKMGLINCPFHFVQVCQNATLLTIFQKKHKQGVSKFAFYESIFEFTIQLMWREPKWYGQFTRLFFHLTESFFGMRLWESG